MGIPNVEPLFYWLAATAERSFRRFELASDRTAKKTAGKQHKTESECNVGETTGNCQLQDGYHHSFPGRLCRKCHNSTEAEFNLPSRQTAYRLESLACPFANQDDQFGVHIVHNH